KDAGFTGHLVNMANYAHIRDNGSAAGAMPPESAVAMRRTLDEMLALKMGGLATLTPGRVAAGQGFFPEFNRVDRTGKAVENSNGLFPRVQQFSRETGEAVARTFGDMPGWQGALIHTEIRDHTAPSFHDIDKETYQREVGA